MRRTFRRRSFNRRPRKMQWVRTTVSVPAPVSPAAVDLLADFKSRFGITINIPDIVIWRVILKISIFVTVSVSNSSSGVLIALFNEQTTTILPNAFLDPYSEKFLWWEDLMVAKEVEESGAITNPVLYKEIDVKTHRKLANMEESLWLQATQHGNATMNNFDVAANVLLKLP